MSQQTASSRPAGRAPSAAEARRQFLDYFAARGHAVVPSGPVFPQDDPTLLFTNAGMNQFKDVFLGTGRRGYTRAVDSQKCIRVSGKHNDLEEVGWDTYHHTFFEMLGNWSFGDYFKEDAIAWSWELLTKVWGLPRERLWVTVFGGDEADGLPFDADSARIWAERTDVPKDHILRFGRKDNFWEMGEAGPCGPCTEIHIDRGPAGCDRSDGADPKRGVNSGSARFIELWNNVFMEFNRLDDGKLRPLPARHVDTGMGLERIAAVLQGVPSNYDTDLFRPMFGRLEAIAGRRYGGVLDEPKDVAFRVAADHARAVTAAFSDGALPSNVGRGYVLRRLIRRAARYGRQHLGLEEPFLFELVPVVAEVLGEAFPEMRARVEHVQLLVREEEASFGRTLGKGLVRFGELESRVRAGGKLVLPGAESFELYATYGFPQDLVELMARERGLDLDLDGWSKAQRAHQDASRSEGKFKSLLSAEQLERLAPTHSTFHEPTARGYELATEALSSGRLEDGLSYVILRESPFYPESGGQVGDGGTIVSQDGAWSFTVERTRKTGNVVLHLGPDAPAGFSPGPVLARVERERRDDTRKNHTATHLLHKALKDVLGAHVNQQGSYVGPDRLRFDFSHPRGVTPVELERVEAAVNAEIAVNAPLVTTVEDLEAAKARGVVALFGEKYDARVRVVSVGTYSSELCGGTHVRAAGDIGAFLITSERAIQAGVRRVEALTGAAAVAEFQRLRRVLADSARLLKSSADDLPARIEQLQAQLKEERKKGEQSSAAGIDGAFEKLKTALASRPGSGGVPWAVLSFPDLDLRALGELTARAKPLSKDLALALFGREGARIPFAIVCQGGVLSQGLKAGDLAKLAAVHLGGGGGGRADLAQGQGHKAEGLAGAIEVLSEALRSALG